MSSLRTYIGLGLAACFLLCLYLDYVYILFIGMSLAIFYDAAYMTYKLRVNHAVVTCFVVLMYLFNIYLLKKYEIDGFAVIKVATITQASDVYQYFAGTRFGKHYIGWVSKNKTYEGYLYGCFLTIATFSLFFPLVEITVIYLLGILSGLLSSLFKRTVGIKDYSDLLGPHGGWVDRIDSIILPILIFK